MNHIGETIEKLEPVSPRCHVSTVDSGAIVGGMPFSVPTARHAISSGSRFDGRPLELAR